MYVWDHSITYLHPVFLSIQLLSVLQWVWRWEISLGELVFSFHLVGVNLGPLFFCCFTAYTRLAGLQALKWLSPRCLPSPSRVMRWQMCIPKFSCSWVLGTEVWSSGLRGPAPFPLEPSPSHCGSSGFLLLSTALPWEQGQVNHQDPAFRFMCALRCAVLGNVIVSCWSFWEFTRLSQWLCHLLSCHQQCAGALILFDLLGSGAYFDYRPPSKCAFCTSVTVNSECPPLECLYFQCLLTTCKSQKNAYLSPWSFYSFFFCIILFWYFKMEFFCVDLASLELTL